jgi:hypothetical protein
MGHMTGHVSHQPADFYSLSLRTTSRLLRQKAEAINIRVVDYELEERPRKRTRNEVLDEGLQNAILGGSRIVETRQRWRGHRRRQEDPSRPSPSYLFQAKLQRKTTA